MSEIGSFLRKLRGTDSLREAAKKTGLSHNYISILEKGIDPRTKSPINPSPETLQAYARGYNYPYRELMRIAGYLKEEDQKESEFSLSESEYDRIISEAEKELNVNLRDDPEVYGAVRDLIWRLARMKKR